MRFFVRFYRLLNLLSVDVAAGAVVNALFFSKITGVQMLPFGIASLFLTVWIIYTVDHLYDADRIPKEAGTARHSFHQKHFRLLLIIVLAAAIINAILLFFIRPQVLHWGGILSLMVVIYLFLHKYFFFLKELAVAIIYTAGVLVPSLAVTTTPISWELLILVFQFFIIALLNLLIYSYYDFEADREDRLGSFATKFGRGVSRRVIVALFFLLGLVAISGLIYDARGQHQLILLMMGVLLLLIFLFEKLLRKMEYYRLFGDAIFFIPLIYLL